MPAPLASPALPTRCQWCDSDMIQMFRPFGLVPVGAVCEVCDSPRVTNRRAFPLLRGKR